MSNRSYVHQPKTPARLLDESAVRALAETFKVLGDATRVRIIDALSRVRGAGAPGSKNDLCVQDIADVLGLTQSAVSHQLRLLRSMRLVRTRRDGRQIFYALDDDHIVKLFEQGLEHVEEQMGVARAVQARDRGPTLRQAQGTPSSSRGKRAALRVKRLRPHRAEDKGIRGEVSASGRADEAGSPTRQPRWGARGAPAPVQKR